ncbi:MAG: ABC transporter permease [Deltaproteobacteria bacterium]|nr:ABC transporter permease [Deltaproteobacteria bacterium]
MRVESLIGLRFLRAKRRDRSISLITWISIAGVMLGVAALIVAISVMNGFRDNMFQAVTGTQPHVRVTPRQGTLPEAQWKGLIQKAAALPGVEKAAPFLSRQAFLYAHNEYRAILLRGVDPDTVGEITELAAFIRKTPYDSSAHTLPLAEAKTLLKGIKYPPAQGSQAAVVMGGPLALTLGVDTGEEIRLISPVVRMTPLGPAPLMKQAHLLGVFETGISSSDEVLVFADYRLAQRLFRTRGEVDGLELRMSSPFDMDMESLEEALPGYDIRPWGEENKNLFQVMKLEKIGLFLILTLIILVAFFNIISSLVMLVLEKRRAIAILKAIGATDSLVQRIFFMQGVWIGFLGTLAGLVLGLGLCWALASFDLIPLPPDLYPATNHLPVKVDLMDMLAITVASFSICVLVNIYPARKASRMQPITHLQG